VSATNQKMTGRCRLNGFAYYDMTATEPNEIDVVLTCSTYTWSAT
jgi:hypothetical protein